MAISPVLRIFVPKIILMLKFISFGSGSSGNCYYLFTEHDSLMIDVGIGIRMMKKRFYEYGLSMMAIRNIFITHDHADHVKSVGSLCKDLCVPVFATREVHAGIDRNYYVKKKIAPQLRRFIEKGVSLHLDDFTVTPFAVPHDSMDCVGYKIECEGKTFCLMTDVGHPTDEMKQLISEANYLVIESNHDLDMLKAGPYPGYLKARITGGRGHMSNEICGHCLADYASEKLKHVWLCHLSHENNTPAIALRTVQDIVEREGKVKGYKIETLDRTLPSRLYDLD